MNLSAILVMTHPEHLAEVGASLDAMEQVEVHHTDAAGGRLIAVLEAPDISAEIALLRQVKALPHVMVAEMVYHYLAEDDEQFDDLPDELKEPDPAAEACAVPAYLND